MKRLSIAHLRALSAISATAATHGRSTPARPGTARSAPIGLLVAGGCLSALSFGAPSGCLGVLSTDEIAPAISTTTYGTAANPAQMLRDNLAFGGNLSFTDTSVRAAVGVSTTFSDSTWTATNGSGTPTVTGSAEISEYRAQGTHYLDQYTPILPDQNFSGAGTMKYGMRAGTMVHGNTYAISMEAAETATGQGVTLNNTTYVQLSPEVLLVPIVVVSWNVPSTQPPYQYTFVDETVGGRNLFDYNPLYIPNQAKPGAYTDQLLGFSLTGTVFDWTASITPQPYAVSEALGNNQTIMPTSTFFGGRNAPDGWQAPPDDIWSQCNIQFQVVAQIEATLPVMQNGAWVNKCNSQALNLGNQFEIEAAVAAKFANNPTLRDYILYDLKPIFVSYGDLSECTVQGFDGNTPGMDRYIEVTNVGGAGTTVTAHELGHALGLFHEWLNTSQTPATPFMASDSNYPMDNGNLMAATGEVTSGTAQLLPAQCAAARGAAAKFSSQYDYFNSVTGRTGYEGIAPPPSGTYTPPAPSTTGVGITTQLCCVEGSTAEFVTTCAASAQLNISQCSTVCCNVSGTSTNVSQYQCTNEGGSVVANGCGNSSPQ